MSPMDNEEVIKRYTNGERARSKLAAAAGISRSKVDRVLMDAGFDLTPHTVSAAQREDIVGGYLAGQSLRALAMRHDLADSTVTLTLRSAGVTLRRQGRPSGRRVGRDLPAEEILTRYREKGPRALAAQLGTSVSTVYRMRKSILAGQRTDPCLADAL